MISGRRTFLVIMLFAVTLLVLQNSATVHPVAIKKTLSLFPEQIGNLHCVSSLSLPDEVVSRLGMDEYIDRIYAAPDGGTIELYVAFYRAVGISGSYHSPANCLPGSGWGIEQVHSVNLPAAGLDRTQVSQMIIRKQNKRRVVFYWYQNRGRIIGSEYMEKIYLVRDALLTGRRDGSFVRLVAPVINDNIKATEKNVKNFSVQVMQELKNFLPGKEE